MKGYFLLILEVCAIVFFPGCTSLQGAFTYYAVDNVPRLNKIGFCQPENIERLSELYKETSTHYTNGIKEAGSLYGFSDLVDLGWQEIEFDKPDSTAIYNLCHSKQLDGILIGKMRFIQVTETMMAIPVNQRTDTEVVLKLFDSEGQLLCFVSHNTYKSNSYHINPGADRTTYDGAWQALDRLFKALDKNRVRYKRKMQPMLY